MNQRLRRIASPLPPPAADLTQGSAYFIGIGGCGMSGLARMLRARGASVTGSDTTPSPITQALGSEGFDVGFDQATPWLPDDCDHVVASAAVRPDHPQLLEAQRRGVPALTYAEALGSLMAPSLGVAIAGTHGKSTTTAMLGHVLAGAGLDPSVIVGANAPSFNNTGYRVGGLAIPKGSLEGEPGILVAEACEYNRSFHNLRPRIASISSVEADHLDVYGSIDAVVEAFHDFARLLPPDSQDAKAGRLLIGHDSAHRREITKGLECRVETIGLNPEADWHVALDPRSPEVTLREHGELRASFRSPMPGVHSAMNSAVAMTLALWLGADPEDAITAIEKFPGLHRRLQLLGDRHIDDAHTGVRVYDDYGHHPTEIELTLRAIRAHERIAKDRRLICVFQPHQHSRTRFFLDEFATAFGRADVVIVPHIYFVRDSEAERQRISAGDLVDRLRERGVRAMHLYPFEAIVEQLENLCKPGDVLVVMGAGPVWQVAHQYLEPARQGELATP